MKVCIQGLVNYISAQSYNRLTSSDLWDPCVVADYVRDVEKVHIPRCSVSKELEPYIQHMKKMDPEYAVVLDILAQPSLPDKYGELLGFIKSELWNKRPLLPTHAFG